MTLASEKVKEQESEEVVDEPEIPKDYDVVRVLQQSGHYTSVQVNGMVVGVRLTGIPETRGVHVEVIHVLDLRRAKFGNSSAGMQSWILESVNQPLRSVLLAVGLVNQLNESSVLTIWGRIPLQTMSAVKGRRKRVSMIHETRTVYVVTPDVRPSLDLSWLTEKNRILTVEEFALARNSDARSTLPDLRQGVDVDKWDALKKATETSFYSVLGIMITAMASVSILLALYESSWVLPVSSLVLIAGIGTSVFFLASSRKAIHLFQETMDRETKQIELIGDRSRIVNAISENQRLLDLINDLNFVVSTLIASATSSVEKGDVDSAVHYIATILDECVRLSPNGADPIEGPFTGDSGLSKFLSLFKTLNVFFEDGEQESLALAYTAISGHAVTPMSIDEVVIHITHLSLALFHAGIIRPDLKDEIDNTLNQWSLALAAKELGEALDIDDDTTQVEEGVKTGDADEPDVDEDASDVSAVLGAISESDEVLSEPIVEDVPDTEEDKTKEFEAVKDESSEEVEETSIPRRHRRVKEQSKAVDETVQAQLDPETGISVVKRRTKEREKEVMEKVKQAGG